MTFDLQRILEGKRAWRRSLAQRPVAEKLVLLDALRDRALSIRAAATRQESARLRESPAGISSQAAKGLTVPKRQKQPVLSFQQHAADFLVHRTLHR